MILPGFRWSEPRTVVGAPPVGECETRCRGCGRRFVAGEPYLARMVGPVFTGAYVHPGCEALVVVAGA